MKTKLSILKENIRFYGRLAIAFSGGVDSAFLAYVASRELDRECIAINALLISGTEEEQERTEKFCRDYDIRYINFQIDELSVEGFKENPPDRCYICKRRIFAEVINAAKDMGFDTVVDGSNADDAGDYRPGMRALAEYGVRSPLMEAGLTKAEIRALSREFGLPTWDLPSSPCLSSRIPYGEIITREKLAMIEKAESYLRNLGYNNCRVRTHGDLARIEVDNENMPALLDEKQRADIVKTLKEIGYTYISLDLSGFRSGSLNDAL